MSLIFLLKVTSERFISFHFIFFIIKAKFSSFFFFYWHMEMGFHRMVMASALNSFPGLRVAISTVSVKVCDRTQTPVSYIKTRCIAHPSVYPDFYTQTFHLTTQMTHLSTMMLGWYKKKVLHCSLGSEHLQKPLQFKCNSSNMQ